jgi:hypothetical protein
MLFPSPLFFLARKPLHLRSDYTWLHNCLRVVAVPAAKLLCMHLSFQAPSRELALDKAKGPQIGVRT